MHAVKLLHKWMADALPEMHRSRLNAVCVGVESVLRGQRLWLTALGRHVHGKALEKHKIKRIDRLLGNHRLGPERAAVYRWLSGLLIGSCRHPCVIVDYSDIDPANKLYLLRAAVAVGGRALVLYEEVHTRYNHPSDTQGFLKQLAKILPDGCQPIIVTDAGFKSPWFRAVDTLGWYYLGRVRNRDYVRFPDTTSWVPAKSLYERASARPKALGPLWIPRASPLYTRAYVYRKHPKGRHRLTARGQRRRNGPSLKHARREREPWLLISNLPPRQNIAKRIVAIYRDRMTIEESFRDLKAHRHGFAFRQSLGRQPERVANLLLIAALATLCAWLTGLIGIERGLDRGLQANTEKRRRVLSVFFIGSRLLKQRLLLTCAEFQRATETIQYAILGRTYETI